MDKRQTEHYNRMNKCKAFFAIPANDTKLRLHLPMDAQLDIFNGRLIPIDLNIAASQKDDTGVTTDTTAFSRAMVKIVLKWAKQGKAYAHSIVPKDDTLFQQLNHSEPEFNALGKAERIALANNMKTALNGKTTPMASYGLTSGIITNIGTAIGKYGTEQTAPEDARTAKTTANENVDEGLNNQDDTLLIMRDLMSHWEDLDQDLIDGFEISYRIDNLPSSPTTIRINFTNAAGDPLAGVTSTLLQISKTFISNLTGMGELVRFTPGEYTLQCNLAGYQQHTATIRIRRGKTLLLNITLQAA